MNPDAALHNLREAIRAWQEAVVAGSGDAEHDAAADAVSTAGALDGWLSRGGHLPAAWSPPPDQAVPDPDVAYAAYAEAARRFGRALECKVAARIRVDFPAAMSIHTIGEPCEDHDLHVRLVAVNGPTGLLADSRGGSDTWDELTDEVDPDLDWLGQLEPDDWAGRQELDLVRVAGPPVSPPDPTPAHPTPPEGVRP
jgi:hypothetical protein